MKYLKNGCVKRERRCLRVLNELLVVERAAVKAGIK